MLLAAALGAAVGGTGCAPGAGGTAATTAAPTTPEHARALLSMLAHDSLEGRLTGTTAAMKAARIIAAEMQRAGLEPLGDDGFLQRVPLYVAAPAPPGRAARPTLATSFAARDSQPQSTHREAVNVVGLLRGADPALREEYVIVGAHYDHVGMSGAAAVAGDSIFNGADDDASGVVAMLEVARQLVEGGAPRRSVIFVAFTGEENGMTGTRWYIASPPRPITQTVADIQVEMIGRPDSVAGGAGKGWLTGYERSTMGAMLSAAGVPVIADPRPEMNFFARSDNYPFARLGIPAHTISSFGGHADYHQVSDEVETIDFAHMATVINAIAHAVRVVSDGAKPTWNAGGRP
jgi:hypothetical protein